MLYSIFLGCKLIDWAYVLKADHKLVPAMQRVASLKQYLLKMEGIDDVEGDAPQYLITCFSFNNIWQTDFLCVVHLFKRTLPLDSKGETPLERYVCRKPDIYSAIICS